jgi:plasmid stabilization system protein ParE
MAFEVRITARAEQDAEEVLRYLEQQSAAASERWHSALTGAMESLAQYPERCGLAPEADELGFDLRQLLLGKRRSVYRILFVVEENTVHVLHIRHAARRPVQPRDLGR